MSLLAVSLIIGPSTNIEHADGSFNVAVRFLSNHFVIALHSTQVDDKCLMECTIFPYLVVISPMHSV